MKNYHCIARKLYREDDSYRCKLRKSSLNQVIAKKMFTTLPLQPHESRACDDHNASPDNACAQRNGDGAHNACDVQACDIHDGVPAQSKLYQRS